MGLFSKFKKTAADIAKEEIEETPWHVLSEMKQLDEIVEQSNSIPVVIFKHSTRCGISRMVLKHFENDYNFKDSEFKLYFLDLLKHRTLSDEVGIKFQVMHQSPQVIIVKNGNAVGSASHHAIKAEDLRQYL